MSEAGFYPSRKLRTRGNEYFAYLNLWPFVGIMVASYAFWLYTRYLISPTVVPAWTLQLSGERSKCRGLTGKTQCTFHVTRDGTLYFNDWKVRVQDLPKRIGESVESGSEKRVYLYVDQKAKYGDVKQAPDGVCDSGIENVSFLVQTERAK